MVKQTIIQKGFLSDFISSENIYSIINSQLDREGISLSFSDEEVLYIDINGEYYVLGITNSLSTNDKSHIHARYENTEYGFYENDLYNNITSGSTSVDTYIKRELYKNRSMYIGSVFHDGEGSMHGFSNKFWHRSFDVDSTNSYAPLHPAKGKQSFFVMSSGGGKYFQYNSGTIMENTGMRINVGTFGSDIHHSGTWDSDNLSVQSIDSKLRETIASGSYPSFIEPVPKPNEFQIVNLNDQTSIKMASGSIYIEGGDLNLGGNDINNVSTITVGGSATGASVQDLITLTNDIGTMGTISIGDSIYGAVGTDLVITNTQGSNNQRIALVDGSGAPADVIQIRWSSDGFSTVDDLVWSVTGEGTVRQQGNLYLSGNLLRSIGSGGGSRNFVWLRDSTDSVDFVVRYDGTKFGLWSETTSNAWMYFIDGGTSVRMATEFDLNGNNLQNIGGNLQMNDDAEQYIILNASTTNTHNQGIQLLEGGDSFGSSGTYGMSMYYDPDPNKFILKGGNQTSVKTLWSIDRDGNTFSIQNQDLDLNGGTLNMGSGDITSVQNIQFNSTDGNSTDWTIEGDDGFGNLILAHGGTTVFQITDIDDFNIYYDVHINGSLSKSSGTFKIDHPLKPDTHYLQHSFVESPEPVNIYKGRVTTEMNEGKYTATVTMPDWFIPLNGEEFECYEYNLTTINSFANVTISQEMNSDGTFQIQSDEECEVSWVVYAVRHDKYILENPIIVELEKPTD